MRKPVFTDDIDYLGVWYWCEIEGFDKIVRKCSGSMSFLEKQIMGWDVKTLGDIWKKQKEVNYAPRTRFWESETEDDMPTPEERAAGEWRDDHRLWQPSSEWWSDDEKMAEFEKTGRTQWPRLPVPDDPVKLNAELAALGAEPLAPMCAGCHFGKWKDNGQRWYESKGRKLVFCPCCDPESTGWLYWMLRQEQPPHCDQYCKIGEYKPSGIFADLALAMQAIEESEEV